MTDFDFVYNLFKRFPKKDEFGNNWDLIGDAETGQKVLFVATGDSYCWGSLIFDKNGKFIGFND